MMQKKTNQTKTNQTHAHEAVGAVLAEEYGDMPYAIDLEAEDAQQDDVAYVDSVKAYFMDLNEYELLTHEAQMQLGKDMAEGGPKAEAARNKLICCNLRLVLSVAKRYTGRGVSFIDLVQEGNIGLIKAAEKFDYSKGYRFSTYATYWVRHQVTRCLDEKSRMIRLPVHVIETMSEVKKAENELLDELHRKPTNEELAEKTGLKSDKIRDIRNLIKNPLSIESPVSDESESTLADFIEDEHAENPEEVCLKAAQKQEIEKLLQVLTSREELVIRLRYGFEDYPHTLDEIGRCLGVTRERVRQIEQRALNKMRRPRNYRYVS